MCLQRVWWPELWLIVRWILCLLRAPCTGANEAVRCERVPAATLGEDVTLKCNFIHSFNVLQVTWQKLEGSSFKNIATYSKAHGTKSIGPFNKRVCFNDTSLKASSITFRGVTLENETCYKCIFNAFPHGSFGRETCLLQSISAVRPELHSNASTPGLLTAVCSATAKPAPEITWKPEGVLIGQPEIHGVKNANSTVTVTSTCNVFVRLLRSKNLQALTCVINHPIGKKERR
ncbi:OX-2 membrane glycoprotein-like [Mauremys reevesii]|uniref:OX-2 membrane glycoprotein-like n=1 Tax=Mauremys reevesii TaxID=260615 RepID=UPI00193FE1A9|nr:OX-2 membrane glycoprotein-like [Mauremys reevesii]